MLIQKYNKVELLIKKYMTAKRFLYLFVIIASFTMQACGNHTIPGDWETYSNNAYSICYPPSMEVKENYSALRNEYEKRGLDIPENPYNVSFQQKGANVGNNTVFRNYNRVICTYFQSEMGTFAKHSEKRLTGSEMGQDDNYIKKLLFEMVLDNCKATDGCQSLIEPSNEEDVKYKWSKINGYIVLSTKYKRYRMEKTGRYMAPLITDNNDGTFSMSLDSYEEWFYTIKEDTVRGEIFIFQDDNRAVVITAACPSNRWDYNWFEYYILMVRSFDWTSTYSY